MSFSFFKIFLLGANFLTIYWGLSSSSFLGFWAMLEMNMLIFIMILSGNNPEEGFSNVFFYFIPQALSSAILMFMIFFLCWEETFLTSTLLLQFGLCLKLGLAPLHMWFIYLSLGVSMKNFLLLSLSQKILPIYLIMLFNSWFINFILWLSLYVSVVEVLGQNKMILLMAFSSIFNSCWVLCSSSFVLALSYFFFYGVMLCFFMYLIDSKKITYLDQSVWLGSTFIFSYFISCMGLMGMPPMVTFLLKVFIISCIVSFSQHLFSLALVMSSFIFFSVYLKMILSCMLRPETGMNFFLSESNKVSSFFLLGVLSLSLILI